MFSLVFCIAIFLNNPDRVKFIKKIKKEEDKISNRIKTISIDIVKKDIGLKLDLEKQINFIWGNNIK